MEFNQNSEKRSDISVIFRKEGIAPPTSPLKGDVLLLNYSLGYLILVCVHRLILKDLPRNNLKAKTRPHAVVQIRVQIRSRKLICVCRYRFIYI